MGKEKNKSIKPDPVNDESDGDTVELGPSETKKKATRKFEWTPARREAWERALETRKKRVQERQDEKMMKMLEKEKEIMTKKQLEKEKEPESSDSDSEYEVIVKSKKKTTPLDRVSVSSSEQQSQPRLPQLSLQTPSIFWL